MILTPSFSRSYHSISASTERESTFLIFKHEGMMPMSQSGSDDRDTTVHHVSPVRPPFYCAECQCVKPYWQCIRFQGQSMCLTCTLRLLAPRRRHQSPPHA
jgi:hypothetical protein